MPLKGQEEPVNNEGSVVDEAKLVDAVASIEGRINLKKFFGELSLGADGEIVANAMSRKFKVERTKDG